MGSLLEINDTLRITKGQGFPAELDIKRHIKNPYTQQDVEGKVYEFKAKEKIRVYKQPPVRNFLVEDLDGKWLYWGLCYILEIHHDYENQMTSGKFKIVRLNNPEEMKQMFRLTHFNRDHENYFVAVKS